VLHHSENEFLALSVLYTKIRKECKFQQQNDTVENQQRKIEITQKIKNKKQITSNHKRSLKTWQIQSRFKTILKKFVRKIMSETATSQYVANVREINKNQTKFSGRRIRTVSVWKV
jgi:ribosomal protein S20